jgi:hypothetical protein
MELVEQFFEKCEGDFLYLKESEPLEIQSPKKLSEIKRVIDITDPYKGDRKLIVIGAVMDSDENGLTRVEILDKGNDIVYILFESSIRFNKRSYVLAKISEEGEAFSEDLLSLCCSSLENSFLTNSQVVVENKLLKANYLALSIGDEWFTSKDSRFTQNLDRNDDGIKFEIINLDL